MKCRILAKPARAQAASAYMVGTGSICSNHQIKQSNPWFWACSEYFQSNTLLTKALWITLKYTQSISKKNKHQRVCHQWSPIFLLNFGGFPKFDFYSTCLQIFVFTGKLKIMLKCKVDEKLTKIYKCFPLQLILVGGFSPTQLKTMTVKIGSSSQKIWGWK